MKDDVAQVRGIFRKRVDYRVAELFPLLLPFTFFQVIRRVLHETGHDVLARWRKGRVSEARNHDINIRTAREAAVLGVIIGALHIFDAR